MRFLLVAARAVVPQRQTLPCLLGRCHRVGQAIVAVVVCTYRLWDEHRRPTRHPLHGREWVGGVERQRPPTSARTTVFSSGDVKHQHVQRLASLDGPWESGVSVAERALEVAQKPLWSRHHLQHHCRCAHTGREMNPLWPSHPSRTFAGLRQAVGCGPTCVHTALILSTRSSTQPSLQTPHFT